MTIAIVDSGFIYAILDNDDEHHAKALSIMNKARWRFFVPSATLVEVFHIKLHRRRKQTTEAQRIQSFAEGLRRVVNELGFEFQEMTLSDYRRVSELLEKYADSGIDYVDAIVIAVAERFGTRYIMTTDQNHFRRYRPNFEKNFWLPLFDS